MSSLIYDAAIQATIGNGSTSEDAIKIMADRHQIYLVKDCVSNLQHNMITTLAYMLTSRMAKAANEIVKNKRATQR